MLRRVYKISFLICLIILCSTSAWASDIPPISQEYDWLFYIFIGWIIFGILFLPYTRIINQTNVAVVSIILVLTFLSSTFYYFIPPVHLPGDLLAALIF